MFGKLKEKFFGEPRKDKPGSNHDPRVATCALLLEMASIDGEFSEKEREDIVAILEEKFGLDHEAAMELNESSRKELDGSIDLWRFTNLINKNYSIEEKVGILELVWKVVYADGIIDKHEDYLVRKVSKLLKLQHGEMIKAKLAALGKE